MPSGFEHYRQDGKLLASTLFVTAFCRRSGTGTTATSVLGNTVPSQISLDVSGFTSPRVVVRMPGYSVAFASRQGNTIYMVTNAPVGSSFTYYLFDRSSTLPGRASGVGVESYNEAGQKTFDSAYWPLKMLARLAPPATEFSLTGESYTRTGSQTLAGLATTFSGRSKPRDGSFLCYTGGASQWDGGACSDLRYSQYGKLFGAQVSSDGTKVTSVPVSWDDVQVRTSSNSSGTPGGISNGLTWESPYAVFAVDVTNIPVNNTFF